MRLTNAALLKCCCGCNPIAWTNATVVPHFDSGVGGTIAPYPRPDQYMNTAACSPADGPDHPLCGKWQMSERPVEGTSDADNNYVLNNHFTKEATKASIDTFGYYKNVQARKAWQGRRPFTTADEEWVWKNLPSEFGVPIVETATDPTCPDYAYHATVFSATPNGTRYLREKRKLTVVGTYAFSNDSGDSTTASAGFTREAIVSIDKDSGRQTQESFTETQTNTLTVNGTETPDPDVHDLPIDWINIDCIAPGGIPRHSSWIEEVWNTMDAVGGRIEGVDLCGIFSPDTVGGKGSFGGTVTPVIPSGWTAAELEARMTYAEDEPIGPGSTRGQSAIVTLTDTSLVFQVTYYRTEDFDDHTLDTTVTFRFEKTLSVGYTAAACLQDWKDLMALIDLTDDCKYPWRNGGECTVAPLVCRREVGTFGISGFSAGWTDPADALFDGKIIGELLPAGYSGFFDFDRTTYEWDTGSGSWQPYTYGIQAPGGESIPVNSTHWTDQYEASKVYPCAFLKFENNVITGQKFAERKVAFPCINFFRPCGADRARQTSTGVPAWDDADVKPICGRVAVTAAVQSGPNVIITADVPYLQNGDTVDFTGVGGLGGGLTVSGASGSGFTVVGTLSGVYAGGGFVSTTGAPSYVWNDETSKGDWQTREWVFDYRLSGEYARLVTYNSYLTDTLGCDGITLPDDPGGDLASFTLTQRERLAAGKVIAVTPNGETWPGGVTLGFPGTFTLDDLYGSLWIFQTLQAIPDPFYKQNTDEPLEQPHYVEPLNTPPEGAPSVHPDVTIGCDVSTCAQPGLNSGPTLTACNYQFFNHLPGTGI